MATEKGRNSADVESGRSMTRLSHWKLVTDQGVTTPEIENYRYGGSGTEDDPYVVVWIPNDPRDPMEFSNGYKWMATVAMAFAVLAVSLNSSMYSGGIEELIDYFGCSEEIALLGLSLFVAGFALGRMLFPVDVQ
jgi:hypothetical protein